MKTTNNKLLLENVIIGAGPAGLSAGIYIKRSGEKKFLLFGKIWSSQMFKSGKIENFPSFIQENNDGAGLTRLLQKQVENLDIPIKTTLIKNIIRLPNKNFLLEDENNEQFITKSIIIATGSSHKHLNIPGEKEFYNSGVSYCAVCDGNFFYNTVTIVIGGGNSALNSAIILSKIGMKHIYIINKNNQFKNCDMLLLNSLSSLPNVTFIYNAITTEILGENGVVTGINYEINNELKTLNCSSVFINIGSFPNVNPLKNMIEHYPDMVDEFGYLKINFQNQVYNQPGLFAAGDVCSGIPQQLIIAAGEGAKAALHNIDFLINNNN